jgi:hypothetical protein
LEFRWKEVAVRSTKLICGRCHEEIVGVVPVWLDDVPVCRNCAYGGSFKRSVKRIEKTEDPVGKIPGTPTPSRIRPWIGVFVLIAGSIIMALSMGNFLKALEAERPHYRGAVDLDRNAEACISNLWKITVLLQNGAEQWPNLKCPSTGKSYKIVHVKGNTIVSCPNPDWHNVTGIQVSRTSPVPVVQL